MAANPREIFELGQLPRTFQGLNSTQTLVELFTVNADGSITFLTAIDPLDASLANFGITSTAAGVEAASAIRPHSRKARSGTCPP